MSQIFRRSSNSLAKVSIVAALLSVVTVVWAAYRIDQGSFSTEVEIPKQQPVQFSHRHHVSNIGIDCRYCHTSVEVSGFAGIPPTELCMGCHSQIWANAEALAPVRDSYRTGIPIRWNRVHDLPDFVYFNHSIHLNKGIGCSSCHGRVDNMQLMYKAYSMHMQWCLECHREPERFVRPRSELYNMAYEAPPNQLELGRRLVAEYKVLSLTDCVVCHR